MTAENAPSKPRCPQCKGTNLALLEFHMGAGVWSSDEWSVNADGSIDLHGLGWNESAPTGRWDYRCEDCGHQWKRRSETVIDRQDRGVRG